MTQEFWMTNPPQVMQAMMAIATRYSGILFGRQGFPVRDGQQGCPALGSVSIAWGSCMFVFP
jgi:hypothetical protein